MYELPHELQSDLILLILGIFEISRKFLKLESLTGSLENRKKSFRKYFIEKLIFELKT